MENLAPPLDLASFIRMSMEQGDSVKSSLVKYLQESSDNDWRLQLSQWLHRLQTHQETGSFLKKIKSHYRRATLQLLEQAYKGEPVYSQLCLLEMELREVASNELETFCASLAFKALIPLLLLQFPAFLIVLVGPLLGQFLSIP